VELKGCASKMLIRRKHTVIGVIAAYVFLIMLIFILKKSSPVEDLCSWSNVCVRFCCNEKKFCNDSIINKSFSLDKVHDPYSELDEGYNPLYGQPLCSLKPIGDQYWILNVMSF
jgi:hypothetical protein